MQEATHDLIFNHLATAYHWKYFAVDHDGKGYVYKVEPKLCDYSWQVKNFDDYDYIGNFDPQGWQDSLIVRIFEEFDESWLNRKDCPKWANYAIIQDNGYVVVADQKPYWGSEDRCYYHQKHARVEIMKSWGVFRITDKYYTRPTKEEGETKMYTKQEAAGISKNVAVASLKKHIENGVKKSVETGLRTWIVPTSCFVPKMLDKEDFIQILVKTGYKLEELDNGDFELRWR